MALQPGTQLGAYKNPWSARRRAGWARCIELPIPDLNRDGRNQSLASNLARDADRLRRFEQEARATSGAIISEYSDRLRHRHARGRTVIVAELLEGEELRDQLNDARWLRESDSTMRCRLQPDLPLRTGKASLIATLNRESLYTTDGRFKILDFGLAKLSPKHRVCRSGVATQKATTRCGHGNGHGRVYVAGAGTRPRGRASLGHLLLGVILYEMLSGKRTFTVNSAIEVMNSILKEDPAELSETNARSIRQSRKIVHAAWRRSGATVSDGERSRLALGQAHYILGFATGHGGGYYLR